MKITVYSFLFSLVTIGIFLILLLGTTIAGAGSVNSTSPKTGLNPKAEITKPEKLLFLKNHLQGLPAKSTLTYKYSGDGETMRNKGKKVELVFEKKDKKIIVTGFTQIGTKIKPIEKISNAVSNPIILQFLEADIIEMQKLTKGQPNYFRKRIRAALAEGPLIKQGKKQYKGEAIDVLHFSIEPYAKDPLRFEAGRSKYRRYSKKKYIFYMSDNVPGYVLGIDYEIPMRRKKEGVQKFYGRQQLKLQ